MKILSPFAHAILDYGLAAAFLLAPSVLDMTGTAAALSHTIGVAYIAVSLFTRYPLGLFKLIPFPTHGVLESLMAVFWIVAPWLFGFSGDTAARNFFVVAGVGLLLVAAITDYRSTASREAWTGPNRRTSSTERRHLSLAMLDERRRNPDRRRGPYAAA